jgi:transitional endoplasmic reticulum ATPase
MTLTVKPVSRADAEDGVAVLGPSAMDAVGVSEGAYVRLVGPDGDETVAQVRAGDDRAGADAIRVDRYLRRSLDADVGDEVTVEGVAVTDATAVTVALPPMTDDGDRALSFRDALVGRAVLADQTLGVALETAAGGGGYTADAAHRYHIHVVDTEPDGPVVVREWTTLTVAGDAAETVDNGRAETSEDEGASETSPERSAEPTDRHSSEPSAPRLAPRPVSYDDVGGLADELAQIRETVELPLRHPDVFERFGVDPPTGLLLHGPPGTGKSLVARAVAHETDVHVEAVSGPAVRSKYAGETEARLRELFESAAEHDAAIVLVDDLGAIAGAREDGVDGDGGAVAQLLSSMDDIGRGDRTVVIGTTTRPEEIDAGLRRPGRFDREVEIGVPDRDGREEILRIHTRSIPLADDIDLGEYAERTHGFVGADLENLLRESVVTALRRHGEGDTVDTLDAPDALDALDTLDALDDLAVDVTAADVEQAFRATEPSALRELLAEVPEVSWADVGGLDGVKERLRESVQWPLLYAEAFERVSLRPPTGILLYGPPGTGKTLLAKAVANEADSNFISVKGPELLDKYVGESEKGVREVFAKARENAPTVVFFDEIDAIATERGSGTTTGVTERVVSQLLTELDGLEDLTDVVVIAATNRPGLVDDALLRPGRLERHLRVGVPDEAGRREIFTVHTEGRPLADDVKLDQLARETDGYVGADIEAVCREAATAAVRRHVHGEDGGLDRIALTHEDFERALSAVAPRTTGTARFERFRERIDEG